VNLPFDREEMARLLDRSLRTLLEGSPQRRAVALAEERLEQGSSDPQLAEALGRYYFRRASWEKAYKWLRAAQKAGAVVSGAILSRLRAFSEDYCPLRPGLLWQYRSKTGDPLEVKVQDRLASGGFEVSVKSGGTVEKQVWEKRNAGTVLCRFFGEGPNQCHYFPIKLLTPAEDTPLPQTVYKVGGAKWKARLAQLDASVDTPAGRFDHCLVVEIFPPGSPDPIRHYFAPGVGEVAVLFSDSQASLSRVLVAFRQGGAASRELRSP